MSRIDIKEAQAKVDAKVAEIAATKEKAPAPLTKEQVEQQKLALMAQLVDFRIGPQAMYSKPATYVMAKNGIFSVKKTPFGTINVQAKEVPYLAEMKEGLILDLPKVPYMIFLQAYSFFKAVTHKSGDEAAIVTYFNKTTGEYENYCPEQNVSGASVKFAEDAEYVRRMSDPNYVRICEMHSHNSMGAFHSGTDNNDEVFDCTFIVFGKLNTANPEHIFSYASSGKRVDSTLWDIFERPVSHVDVGGGAIVQMPITNIMYIEVPFPDEWHTKLKKYSSYSYKGTASGGGYGGYWRDGKWQSWKDEKESAKDYGYDDYGYGEYGGWYGGYGGYTKGEYATSHDKEREASKEAASKVGSLDEYKEKKAREEKKEEVKYNIKEEDELLDALDVYATTDDIIYDLEQVYGTTGLEKLATKLFDMGYGYESVFGNTSNSKEIVIAK